MAIGKAEGSLIGAGTSRRHAGSTERVQIGRAGDAEVFADKPRDRPASYICCAAGTSRSAPITTRPTLLEPSPCADLGQATFANTGANSSGHWRWRDGFDRQVSRSRRHARPVSATAIAGTIAQPRGLAGVATASRSDVRSGRRLSDPAVGSTRPSHSTSGRPPRTPPINPDDNDRPNQQPIPHQQRPTPPQPTLSNSSTKPNDNSPNRNSQTAENNDYRASPSKPDQCTN